MLVEVLSRENVSTMLGYSSIVAWLFAQMPQVLENYKNGSVEGELLFELPSDGAGKERTAGDDGRRDEDDALQSEYKRLALPFLVSWLCGDFTNLVGCILTHQLRFQTALASYFVAVDVALMSQYIYYSSKHPVPGLPPLSESYPHAQAPDGRHSHSHSHSRRPHKRRRRSGATSSRGKSTSAGGDDPLTRSWMSEASTGNHSPASTRQNTNAYPSRDVSRQPSRQASSHFTWTTSSGSAISTEPPSPTIPERGRTLTRPARPAVPVLETISGSPASGSPVPGLHQVNFRGEVTVHGGEQAESRRPSRGRPANSTSRSRPPPSRRPTSSMLFLSVGLLVTFGKWSGGVDLSRGGDENGVAWSVGAADSMLDAAPSMSSWGDLRHPTFFGAQSQPSPVGSSPRLSKRQTFPIAVSVPSFSSDLQTPGVEPSFGKMEQDHGRDDGDEDEKPPLGRDWERFIGRASAWMCTTLYLTSRLPQIWQNFRRRSVEGLSMLLFVMAFVGNSLYVLSILTNPLMDSPGYLLESTPYLLGSGGTLCFDITIVLQSLLYSSKRKAAQERARRRRDRFGVHEEEAAALLDDDVDNETETDFADDLTSGANSRNPSLGPSRSRSSRRTISRKRSDATELGPRKSSSRSRSRASRDPFEDRPFEFETRASSSGAASASGSGSGERGSPSTSRGPTRTSSVVSTRLMEITEQGESSVTLR